MDGELRAVAMSQVLRAGEIQNGVSCVVPGFYKTVTHRIMIVLRIRTTSQGT